MTTAVNWTKIETDFDTFIQNNGVDVSVRLRDGVTTFTIKGAMRRTSPENLTDGLQQHGERLSVMRSRWDAGAGRTPNKGDQVTISGRRQAIMSWNPVEVPTTSDIIGYNLRLSG